MPTVAQNGKFNPLKIEPKVRDSKDLTEKETGENVSTPLKTFNLNSRNWNGKPESFDKLMAELKALMKKKENESEANVNVSHENMDPEADMRDRNVQTLIRPQLTNPKIFWSKSEDEDFASDQKHKKVRNDLLEKKIIKNVFKPIRSDISPEVRKFKTVRIGNKIKEEDKMKKGERSIHESLRMQKVKRRTSLPFCWNEESWNQEVAWNADKVKTYDISYYSTILKRMTQEGNSDYYLSTRKKDSKHNQSVKSASDECIYDDRHQADEKYTIGKESQSERLSVTEPSSPFVSSYSIDVNRNTDRYTDSDSESTGSDHVRLDIKKSKSFIDEKESDYYFKPKKSNVSEFRKPSISSASSYDSSCRSKTNWKTLKEKQKLESDREVGRTIKSQDYVRGTKKSCRKSEKPVERRDKEGKTFRRKLQSVESENSKRSQSCVHPGESKTEEGCQKINPDIFQHLLEVLMQKNRTEESESERKELFTKSLPRQPKQSRGKTIRKEGICEKSCGRMEKRSDAELKQILHSSSHRSREKKPEFIEESKRKNRRASGSVDKKRQNSESIFWQ